MNRRNVIGLYGCLLGGLISGCVEEGFIEDGENSPVLRIYVRKFEQTSNNWTFTVRLRSVGFGEMSPVSIHDVTLHAFDELGRNIDEIEIGDMVDTDTFDRDITIDFETFPAIFSATAQESPCDDAQIDVLYWIGSAEQRTGELDDEEYVWESTDRDCNEQLPPERAIEKVKMTPDQ